MNHKSGTRQYLHTASYQQSACIQPHNGTWVLYNAKFIIMNIRANVSIYGVGVDRSRQKLLKAPVGPLKGVIKRIKKQMNLTASDQLLD